MKPHTLRLLYSSAEIDARVRAIAEEINMRYAGEPLVVICVLKGAFMFFSDLLKYITVKPEIDFVRLASYGGGIESSRAISFTKDVEISLQGKHILLVEDVVDSGITMSFMLQQMQARQVASIALATLVDKQERREACVSIDFSGFTLSDGFIVGYGLDYAEKYRELPAIYVVDL